MLHISFWNGYFNVRGTKEDPIPNMIKLELTYIFTDQDGIAYPYVDWLFN